MKNITRKILVLVLSVVMFVGVSACKKNEETPPESENIPITREIGNFLPMTAAAPSYSKVVSGAGMSGTGGRIHLHDNVAENSYNGEKSDFVFELPRIEQVGELAVWNYNVAGSENCGLKEVKVLYSIDNITYNELGTFQLAKANGATDLKATNLIDGKAIDLGGVSAKYVKFTPVSNYGGIGFGLSEVRAFRYKHEVKVGGYIAAGAWDRLNNKGEWTAKATDYNITNGSGMSNIDGFSATHDNKDSNMATISNSAPGFKIDLYGNYPVKQVSIWNYNGEDLSMGIKTFKIQMSEDGIVWKSTDRKTYTLAKGDGTGAMAKSLDVVFSEPIHTRYIMVEVMSNYGGDKTGLSEVRCMIGDGWFADDAPDYSALMSNYDGWSGSDGTYTVNLDGKDYDENRKLEDKNTFFVFSDTIISSVNAETNIRKGVYMPNNTSALLKGGMPDSSKISFKYPVSGKDAANIKPIPAEPASYNPESKNKYYWLGDTFVIGSKLYVYALKIDNVDPAISGFGFAQVGVDLASYNIVNGEVDYNSLSIIKDSGKKLCNVDNMAGRYYFGGAVLENANQTDKSGGYVYVYGYYDKANSGRKLVVSRVKESDIEKFGEYEFLAADGNWVKNMNNPKFLASDVAPEVSVSVIQSGANKGKYLFTNTHFTTGNDIKVSVSDTPYGEFTDKISVFYHDATFTTLGQGNNSYNAKAHPALSKKGELLISYNVNGNDCFTYGDIYRSRFIKLGTVPNV